MKKLLYCAAALAAMFFTACQQENLEPVAGENTVTYTVNVSDVATKAIGNDVNSVNELYYQVYNNDNVLFYDGYADIDGGVASVNLKFVKEQTFKVLFWAQNENLEMFNTTDLRAVTLNLNTPLTSNNVNAQVFAGFDTVVDCESTAGGNVKLVRPISQLNIATSKESLEHGIELEKSTVSVSGLYPVYNVYEGVASGDKDNTTFEYGEAAVLLKEDNTYQTLSVNGEEYTYVAMNYVGFAPKDASTTVDVEFTITTSEGDVKHTVSNVPVKRNYRTNIVGDLITESTDYNISLDNAWATEEYTEIVVSTASDLQTTINEAPVDETVEISLSGDINLGDLAALLQTKSAALSNTLTIPAGKSVVLNLNGYSISGVDETQTSFGLIKNHGTLSIVNTAKDKVSKLQLAAKHNNGWNRYSSVISSEPLSTLTVGKGIVIEHLGGTDMAYGIDVLTNGGIGDVNVTIDGATVKSTYRAIRQFLNSDSKENNLTVKNGSVIESTGGNKSIWMQDPSAKSNKGSLVVEAEAQLKNDVYLTVTAGSAAWPVSVSIADSAFQGEATVVTSNIPSLYDVVLKDGIWTVETSFTFAEFVEAVIAAEGTYNGEGKTVKILPLSGKSDNTNGSLIPNRLQKYTNPEVYYAQYQRFAELQDVDISNVNFVFVPAAITVQDAWNAAGATTTAENVNGELQFMNSGSVTLTGCTFDKVAVSPINAPALTVADCQFSDLMAYAIKDIKAATISITGTEFNNCNGGFWFNAAPTTLTVTNNTFTEVGRRGAIQFSANGDYSNTPLNISGNTVDGIFLWQLNETITEAQLKPVLGNNTYTTDFTENSKVPVDYAKIGDKGYKSLQAAIEAVQEGETVVLLKDLEVKTPAYGQNALNYARAINFTLDLNGKTLSANTGNSVFRYNITQAGATDDVTVTIKNGTITAGADTWCVVMAAGLSADVRAVYNLEDLTINASKPGDLAVKAWDYALINAKNVTVNATKGAGGFYAVGGEIVLDNCTVNQEGLWTAPYLSMAVAVSTGGKATVNSGTYTSVPTAASEGYNQGSSHGSWAAGVMNSGGELIINGGTFANGNFGDDALATAARGLIFGDTASKIVINNGTFNALKSIIDYQNNLGVQPNPNIVINGGNFSADPSVVTSYGGVVIKEGFTPIQGTDGRWTLVEGNFIKTEAALKAAFEKGGEITLGANIVLSETIVLPEGKTATLNLNGMTLSHNEVETKYAINNHGNLTITGNGTVNSRGIYNGYDANGNYVAAAKLTIENGTFNAKGTNGGACVYNYGTVAINGGNFESVGGYGLNNQSGAVMTLKNASVRGGIYVSGATLKVENSTVYQHISGRHAIYNWSGNIIVESGSFDSESGNELILADGTNASVVLNGGTYNKTAKSWLLGAATNKNITFVINGGTYNGYVNLPENTVDTIRPYGDPIVVKGGVFNFNPTQWLAEGYEAVNNASGWMVKSK